MNKRGSKERDGGGRQMKWKVNNEEYETVAQFLAVVQKNQFVAVAAGVVVHQHTRVLWQTCTGVVMAWEQRTYGQLRAAAVGIRARSCIQGSSRRPNGDSTCGRGVFERPTREGSGQQESGYSKRQDRRDAL